MFLFRTAILFEKATQRRKRDVLAVLIWPIRTSTFELLIGAVDGLAIRVAAVLKFDVDDKWAFTILSC